MLDFLITRFPFLSVSFIELRLRNTYLQDELIRLRTENTTLKEELAQLRSALLAINQSTLQLLATNNRAKEAYHHFLSTYGGDNSQPPSNVSTTSELAAEQLDQIDAELPSFISSHLERMETLRAELEEMVRYDESVSKPSSQSLAHSD